MLFTKYYLGDQARENGMGGACGTYGVEGSRGLGKSVSHCCLNRLDDVDWIHLVQDRDKWPAVLRTVMDVLVP